MDQRECARLQTQDGQAMNLLGVKLSADLRGLMFEARIEQRFCNPSSKNVEVVYSFPLPWGAVLLGVDVVLGDKQLTGAVVEKKQAEARYEEAISQGDAAIMLEQNRDHSYSLNLGNLAARENCTITLRYAQTLQFEQRGLRLLIPTVIAPRYGDAEQDGGLLPHQTPSHSLRAEHPFELELRLHGDLAQARVASPSHPVGVAHGPSEQGSDQGGVLTVSLARRASLDRDFVLVLDRLAHDSVAVAAQDWLDPHRVALLASFCPRIRTQGTPSTALKILVDCSGSMAGDSMDAAKRALQAIVGQLGGADRFSLSRFGSTVEHRSRGLWKTTETTKLAAQRWVGALKADLGGTEMEAALSSTFALAQTASSDMLLVTDGEISAIDSTIESAQASGHRLFVVGIGSSPAEIHLRRLAQATGGTCDFVAPGEAVEPAVLRMFARLRSPRLADLSLQWPEGVAPERVSLPTSVFDGDTVNVFAVFKNMPTGQVHLLGKRCDNDVPLEIGAATLPTRLEVADTLSRLAASVYLHSNGKQRLIGQPMDATRLALDYQLVTNKTNFLLVHERAQADKASEMPELQKVDQMLAAGWGGTGSVQFSRYAASTDTQIIGRKLHEFLPCLNYVPLSVSTVFRMVRAAPTSRFSAMDDTSIPAFLRRRDQIIDHEDRHSWAESEHYRGLTPLGVSEWLRNTAASQWPTNYMGLQQIGLGTAVLDWLEFEMASHQGALYAESQVVEAFLYLMSRPETHAALAKSKGLLGPLKPTALRLRGTSASAKGARPAGIDAALVAAMGAALDGMTASAWPDRVLSLGAAVDAVGEAGEAAISS